MRTEANGDITGTPEELLKHMEDQINLRRTDMHRALDLAIELLRRVMGQPIVPVERLGNIPGVDMGPIFNWLTAETGVEFTEEQKVYITVDLTNILHHIGGMSVCAAYDLAHTLEHALAKTTH